MNKISLWIVHLSVLLNILFLIVDFTFPKSEEEIFLEHVYTKGFDSRRSKKQVIIEFDTFTIYGNNDVSKILDKNPENKYYLQKNVFFNNRAFIKVFNEDSFYTNKVFIGYHCYNPYFIYLLFVAVMSYCYLFYNSTKKDFFKLIPYFAIPTAIVFLINIIVQF
ncbi:hypothetical protein H1R17_07860 [Flavobacterium sp. xlx-214]|uniref:hypothetical protein n=1 Tax=unclassified Flavobacterium TaxID=196869 RepID=UPI0013D01807|nr:MULTISPECIES: hypothetical protein [unclassified Flavobacterium]MBA5792270.1 hypothetical protein [Flavobacterium sp. xlx-221]QMI82413.1 hypothetical protein H1R17_07860 [Flavobacterium sp. xlx-214]